MKRVFLDVNVFFDFVFGRQPFYEEIWQVISMARNKDIICGTSPNCFPHSFHDLKKEYENWENLKHNFALLRKTIEVSSLNSEVLDAAISMKKPEDLEDAVVLQLALHWNTDVFLTRDKKGFTSSAMKIMSPKEFLSTWEI